MGILARNGLTTEASNPLTKHLIFGFNVSKDKSVLNHNKIMFTLISNSFSSHYLRFQTAIQIYP